VPEDYRKDLRISLLQELNTAQHFVRAKDISNQHGASDEQSDRCFGRREQDAGMTHPRCVQPEVVGIGGDQDSALRPSEGKKSSVRNADLSGFYRS